MVRAGAAATVGPVSDEHRPSSAGTGYVVAPDSGSGPGVVLLHAWWGLTPFFKSLADRLADAGFVALAPDLYGDNQTVATPDEAEALLAASSPDRAANLVAASVTALHGMPATPDRPVGIVGFSMGASWGLWAAARLPELVSAVSLFYGASDIDLAPARAAFQGHFAEHDEFVSDDELVLMEADLRLRDQPVEFHHYAGTGHWFMESDRPAAFVASAAALAWDRTVQFLHEQLDQPAPAS